MKTFRLEVTRYYTKYITIEVEAESMEDAREKLEVDDDLNKEISKQMADAPLHWDDDTYEVYTTEEAV
jgi:hypothetical protein